MTNQEIIDNAPDGATDYSETPMEYIYLKKSNAVDFDYECYAFGKWIPYDVEDGEEIKPLK